MKFAACVFIFPYLYYHKLSYHCIHLPPCVNKQTHCILCSEQEWDCDIEEKLALCRVCNKCIYFLYRPMQTIDCVHHIHGCCLSQRVSQMRPWRLLPVTGAPNECLLLSGGKLVAHSHVDQGLSELVMVIGIDILFSDNLNLFSKCTDSLDLCCNHLGPIHHISPC